MLRLLPTLVLLGCGGTTNNPAAPDAPDDRPIDAADVDAPTSATDPAEDGPATVAESTASIPGATAGRTLAATVFAPATGTGRPLAIVSPGFQMPRTQYASYARHLATWGFVVILTDYAESGFAINHDRIAADVPAVIDWAVAQTQLAVDATKVATLGHSLGGKTSVFAAAKDARIRAVVAWDPVDSTNPSVAPQQMSALTAAIAVIGETTNGTGGFMPCAPAAENFQQFYAAAPSPAMSLTVTGADHMDWVDDPSCGLCGFCTAGSAAPDLVRKVTRRLDVAWLRRHLLADASMDTWLAAPPEAASLVIEQR